MKTTVRPLFPLVLFAFTGASFASGCGEEFTCEDSLTCDDAAGGAQSIARHDGKGRFAGKPVGCQRSLAKWLEGKTVQEALQLCSAFLSFITKESATATLPEELLAFSGVRDFPERLDCAALSWREMKKFLESRN